MAEKVEDILDEFRWQIKGVLKSGTAEPTEHQLRFQREALDRINKLMDEVIGPDDYYWNQSPNGASLDFAMTPEAEATYNRMVDDRNNLKAMQRQRLAKLFKGDK